MSKLLLINVILLLTTIVHAQKKSSIELNLIGLYDKHADYTTRFGNRSYTNATKLWGKSFGLSVNYIRGLPKNLYARIGVGYYYLGVDKVRQTTPFNIIATERNIGYQDPSGILPLFATREYHYNDLDLTFGLSYEKTISKKVNFIAGGEFNYLYTFSQVYHITYGNIRYRTNNGRILGLAAKTYLGLLRKFHTDKYYVSLKIVFPVYQQLQGDEVFGEEQSVKMEKRFRGVSFCLAIGRYL